MDRKVFSLISIKYSPDPTVSRGLNPLYNKRESCLFFGFFFFFGISCLLLFPADTWEKIGERAEGLSMTTCVLVDWWAKGVLGIKTL